MTKHEQAKHEEAIHVYHAAHRALIDRLVDDGFPHASIERELTQSLAFARAVNEFYGMMHCQKKEAGL